jgi:hypothetical protein
VRTNFSSSSSIVIVAKFKDRRHPFDVDVVELAEGFFDIFVYRLCVHFIPTFKCGMKAGFARKARASSSDWVKSRADMIVSFY